MENEEKNNQLENSKPSTSEECDDGKISFPWSALIICGVLLVLIITCIIVIFALKK